MFNINEKVVFVDCNLPRHQFVIYPELNEVVTISKLFFDEQGRLFVLIKEYPKPIKGEVNGILAICFRKIDKTFAKKVLDKIIKDIELELIEKQ